MRRRPPSCATRTRPELVATDPDQHVRATGPRIAVSRSLSAADLRAPKRERSPPIDLVAPLLRRTFRNIDLDVQATSPGRILFELLWPESLKHQSVDERTRRLILDERSAAFPWELLDDRRPWISDEGASASRLEPPAVRAGTVRQLLQGTVPRAGRHRSRHAERARHRRSQRRPDGGFRQASGAEAEAKSVATLLANDTHVVTTLVNGAATPEQVCKQLFAQAWEIVHISAHGVVDYELTGSDGIKRRMTGVVLGGGVVLGPSALSKLPVSPSIFFVNCCNLGKIDAAAEDKARQASLEGRPEFAASVAVELIRLGVRCVIVAGWKVDDDAAPRSARGSMRRCSAARASAMRRCEPGRRPMKLRPTATPGAPINVTGTPTIGCGCPRQIGRMPTTPINSSPCRRRSWRRSKSAKT